MDQKKIGLFLKELRKQKGITQEELAEHFNVSSRSISRWETGSNMPDISLLTGIADFYDVDVREIIEGGTKSGMNEEIKEVADKMAAYAGAEKGSLFKWVRIISLAGTVLLTIAIVLQCVNYEPNIVRAGGIALSFLGLIALAVTTLYANGILAKLAKKKAFKIIVQIVVASLIVISLKFIIVALAVIGLGTLEEKQPYDKKTGIESYDKISIIKEYGSDLDSGLFLFPDDTKNAIKVDFESSLKTGLFDTEGSIFLSADYTDEDFNKERNRLSQVTCTVYKTNYEDSDYHVGKVEYDTDSYNYPAYVACDGYDNVYEYALLDEENNRIVYVLLSNPFITESAEMAVDTDYLKKDIKAYDLSGDNDVLDNFTIYSYSFSKGIWSEYSLEDEGRTTKGNLK
ncbi:MAG: helix-turn-helix domain-containing protein [Lachnospiraceae bacterium]|nr:helix-turn-helix domain-containing protein [Lachnospiraceae bacterium]